MCKWEEAERLREMKNKKTTLIHLFPMHPVSTPENIRKTVFWCFQGVEKGCNWNKLVKKSSKYIFNL